MLKSTILTIVVALATLTSAHPGESEDHHLAEARAIRGTHQYLKRSGSSYSTCSNSARKRSLNDAVSGRRAAEIASLRAGIQARKLKLASRQVDSAVSGSAVAMPTGTMSAGGGVEGNMTAGGGAGGGGGSASFDTYGETLLNTSHASNRTDLTSNSTSSELFDSTSTTNDTACLLQPEVTIGPYWVAGEYVRGDMSEDQAGLPIYMSTQVIDVSTCEPVVGLYWEMWHANASGVYSGVVASGNGDSSDVTNINNTFCRGIQPTDDMGVATIQSIFPGHYTGRATHVHVVGHANATVYSNGTIGTGSSGDGDSVALHIGQLFFDQDLLTAVAAVSPYSNNTQTVTENSADSILAESAVEGASDPFFEYVYLGDDIEDGIYAWVTVGITTNETMTTQAAAYLDADGGHVGTDSLDMGGGVGGGNASSSGPATTASSVVSASASTSTDSTAIDLLGAASSSSEVASSSNEARRSLPTLGGWSPGRVSKQLREVLRGGAP